MTTPEVAAPQSTKGRNVVSGNKWYLPEIDGLRALAILLVFSFHAWEFSGATPKLVDLFGLKLDLFYLFPRGASGVDLFMVLSGFCLFLPLCKTETLLSSWNWRNFYKRRIHRIVPPYYAAIVYVSLLPIAAFFLAKLLNLPAVWTPLPSGWQYLTHLLFIHTLFPDTYLSVQGAFWSLGLEAQFYLVFPVIIFLFRRLKLSSLGLIIAISIFYRIATGLILLQGIQADYSTQFVVFNFFLGRWMQFALGMGAAVIVAQHLKAGKLQSKLFGTVVLILATIAFFVGISDLPQALIIFPAKDLLLGIASAAAIVALCVSTTPIRHLFKNKFVVKLGVISYSLFLIHQYSSFYLFHLLTAKLHLGNTLSFIFICTVILAIVIGLSYVFYSIFEKPFLNKRKPALQTSPELAVPAEVS